MGELFDKAKGKAKEVQGRVTGDRLLEAEGVADQVKGKAKGAFEELKTDVKRAVRKKEGRADLVEREREDQRKDASTLPPR